MRFRQGKLSTLAPPLPVVSIATRTSATITTAIQITVRPSPALTMIKCHTIQGSVHTQFLLSVGDRGQLPQRYFSKFCNLVSRQAQSSRNNRL